MAERIADNADFAVDELKRRARRRLVGAIVLALAAAVILPLLLEKEPKPLGDDVSVQIPPVDEGRFINRLTGRSGESKNLPKADTRTPKNLTPKAESAPPSTPQSAPEASPAPMAAPAPVPSGDAAPRKSVAEAEQRVLAPANKGSAKAEPKSIPAPAPEAKVEAKAPPAAPVTTPSLSNADATDPAATVAGKAEGFAVQIAAFTDDKGANALTGKLKKAGYAATYTETVETSHGTLWRVRVGGFSTRPEAEATRAKLKAEGWNGLVVAVK